MVLFTQIDAVHSPLRLSMHIYDRLEAWPTLWSEIVVYGSGTGSVCCAYAVRTERGLLAALALEVTRFSSTLHVSLLSI